MIILKEGVGHMSRLTWTYPSGMINDLKERFESPILNYYFKSVFIDKWTFDQLQKKRKPLRLR